MNFIETHEDLRKVYKDAGHDALRKELPRLDSHARTFLAMSPFVLIGTQDPQGHADVSPKGDRPGFVIALDDHTLAIPDRPGNNRLDSWENILTNPAVGLIFLIPGVNETLRVNGEARITADPELCARLSVQEKPAISALVVRIRAVYMHCAKAFIRSRLWQAQTWPDRGALPTLGQILHDQLALTQTGDEVDSLLDEAYRKSLW